MKNKFIIKKIPKIFKIKTYKKKILHQKKNRFKIFKKVFDSKKFILNHCKFMKMNFQHSLDNIKIKFQRCNRKIF